MSLSSRPWGVTDRMTRALESLDDLDDALRQVVSGYLVDPSDSPTPTIGDRLALVRTAQEALPSAPDLVLVLAALSVDRAQEVRRAAAQALGEVGSAAPSTPDICRRGLLNALRASPLVRADEAITLLLHCDGGEETLVRLGAERPDLVALADELRGRERILSELAELAELAELPDAAGADVTLLAEAIGLDERIGRRFLRAGVGFGGGCLPKDIRAFRDRAADLGVGEALDFLADVDAVNDSQRTRAVRTVRDLLGGLAGRRIAVLGAAFKPDSDDVRTSPGLLIAAELEAGGASVAVTDPAAGPALEAHGGHAGEFVAGVQDAVAGADAVLLATEWEEYRRLDPARLAGLVRRRVVFDGRNALDPARWKAAGWTYRGVGRR